MPKNKKSVKSPSGVKDAIAENFVLGKIRDRKFIIRIAGIIVVAALVIAGALYLYLYNDSGENNGEGEPEFASFEENYNAAQNALSEEDNLGALGYLEMALNYASDEERIPLLYETGHLAFSIGEYDKAIKHLEELMALAADEETKSKAGFYLEQSKQQKLSDEALESQQFEEGGETPATSEAYEQL